MYKYLSEESIWRVPAFFHTLHPYSWSFPHRLSQFSVTLTSCHRKVQRTVHVPTGFHPCLWPDRRRMDPVSKPPFVLEPRSGSDEQMWKQCSHWGEAVTEAAITDSVDLAQQSQSAYCLSDICFTLYKIQTGLAASGAVIKLHIDSVAGLCLRTFTVTSRLCTSRINDWALELLFSADMLCT